MTPDKLRVAKISCIAIAAIMSLGGCNVGSRTLSAKERNSHFEEMNGDRFQFTVMMNAEYQANDPKAEALRQRWLDEDLAMSNRCSNGGTLLLDRDVINEGQDPQTGASIGKIVYEGACSG